MKEKAVIYMNINRGIAFLTRLHERPARAVWSESSQGALWVTKEQKRFRHF